VNFADKNTLSPLEIAITTDDFDIIYALLTKGADLNLFFILARRELLIALLANASYDGNIDMVRKILLDKSAIINLKTNLGSELFGVTPLMMAAKQGHIEIVKLLLKSGADINLQGDYFRGQLMQMTGTGVKVIPEETRSNVGFTALMFALERWEVNCAKLLIEYGADLRKKDFKGRTALKIATKEGLSEIVNILRSKGVEE
jgi:ankyrin repeat protein